MNPNQKSIPRVREGAAPAGTEEVVTLRGYRRVSPGNCHSGHLGCELQEVSAEQVFDPLEQLEVIRLGNEL